MSPVSALKIFMFFFVGGLIGIAYERVGGSSSLVPLVIILGGCGAVACVEILLRARHNLTMRMQMRRFTRLTNAFSKKIENNAYALALYFFWYNWVRSHKAHKPTPAMAAGLTKSPMEMADLVEADGRAREAAASAARCSKRRPRNRRLSGVYGWTFPRRKIMKLLLIAVGLLATTGVAACMFC